MTPHTSTFDPNDARLML